MTTAKAQVGRTFGQYRLNRLLGKGGMGQVYEAYDTVRDRTVALKILAEQFSHDAGFRTRFQRESHAAAILQEPHVVPIHDWGEIDGNLYIDMRLVNGQTLQELIKRGPVEPERAVAIIEQVAAALDAAHTEGLIHRDVKPQNIILTPADFAYLVDFGIAQSTGDTQLTMAGQQIGSLDYMAPERFTNSPTTPAADVYSLACVLYQMLTGELPFPGHNAAQIMAAHLAAPPPRPSVVNPGVPAAFDDVVARGMAREPDDRYGGAGALARASRRALHGNGDTFAQASTLLAGRNIYPYPGTDPGRPEAHPAPPVAVAYDGDSDNRLKRWVLPITVAVASALLLGAVGVIVGLLAGRNSQSDTRSEPPTGYPPPATYTVAAPTTPATQAWTPPTRPSRTASPTASSPADPEGQLRQLAHSDLPYVRALLANQWVPQLSSKRPGVVDDGVVWDNALTLQEHLRLRQRYPGVRLLWSGDWSTFSAPNFWVTVVGITFPDSSGALAWCRNQGFDADHCIAKVVSTTLPIAGTTAYN